MSVGQANFVILQSLFAATVAHLILGNFIMSELIQSIEIYFLIYIPIAPVQY